MVVTTILGESSGGLKTPRARLPRTEHSPHPTLTKSQFFPLLPKRNYPANGAQNVQRNHPPASIRLRRSPRHAQLLLRLPTPKKFRDIITRALQGRRRTHELELVHTRKWPHPRHSRRLPARLATRRDHPAHLRHRRRLLPPARAQPGLYATTDEPCRSVDALRGLPPVLSRRPAPALRLLWLRKMRHLLLSQPQQKQSAPRLWHRSTTHQISPADQGRPDTLARRHRPARRAALPRFARSRALLRLAAGLAAPTPYRAFR